MTRAAAGKAPPGPGPRHLVDSYLAEVTAGLPGPARARAGIVDELRRGSWTAIDAYRSAGLTAEQAAQAAVSEFGDPGQVASAFRRGSPPARPAARDQPVATGPLIGLLWAAAATAQPTSAIRPCPRPGNGAGRATRLAGAFPPGPPQPSPSVAIWAGTFDRGRNRAPHPLASPSAPASRPPPPPSPDSDAMAVDLIIFVLLASQLAARPARSPPRAVAVAASASLVRHHPCQARWPPMPGRPRHPDLTAASQPHRAA